MALSRPKDGFDSRTRCQLSRLVLFLNATRMRSDQDGAQTKVDDHRRRQSKEKRSNQNRPPNREKGGPFHKIAATLPPGPYTALAGLNNGAGVGLVEVYDLGP